jgi:diaminopimelate epimerase
MTKQVEFTKMHGLGNDFIVVEAAPLLGWDLPALARGLCHRQTGVGADGLLLASAGSRAGVAQMRIFNADGSEAAMCGNGIRCFARYVYDRGIARQRQLTVQTGAGAMGVAVQLVGDEVVGLQVDMGIPRFEAAAIPMLNRDIELGDHVLVVAGAPWRLHALRMGVPHAVTFVEQLATVPFSQVGPMIERNAAFPEGVNVNFVEVLSTDRLRVRTWERGAGLTLACGTGACAAAVVAARQGFTAPVVSVELELGELSVELKSDGHVLMTGPADYVCTGRFDAL